MFFYVLLLDLNVTDFCLHGRSDAEHKPANGNCRKQLYMGDMGSWGSLLKNRHVGDGVAMATVCEEYVCRLQIWEILTSSCHHTWIQRRSVSCQIIKGLSYEAGCCDKCNGGSEFDSMWSFLYVHSDLCGFLSVPPVSSYRHANCVDWPIWLVTRVCVCVCTHSTLNCILHLIFTIPYSSGHSCWRGDVWGWVSVKGWQILSLWQQIKH